MSITKSSFIGTAPVYPPEHTFIDKQSGLKKVNLRHRLPFADRYSPLVRVIDDEIDTLPHRDQNTFRQFWTFCSLAIRGSKAWVWSTEALNLISYIEGAISLEDLHLTKENAAYYLRLVKLFDLAHLWQTRVARIRALFPNSTYEIRTRLLELLSPEIETAEVYTYSIIPRPIEYYKDIHNWVPERIRFLVAFVLLPEFIRMRALSVRLGTSQARVYAVRGMPASYKTTLLHEHFGDCSGAETADNKKLIIKMKTTGRKVLSNIQVDKEVKLGPLSLYKEGLLRSKFYSLIVDSKLSTNEKFAELVQAAKIRNCYLSVIDIEAPLQRSMRLVLRNRTPEGADPCVVPAAIRDAFMEIRKCRPGIIETVKQEPCIDHYELLHIDPHGNMTKVAEKTDASFRVLSDSLFQESLAPPSVAEITETMDQPAHIAPWNNIPIRIALGCHASGRSLLEAHQHVQWEHQYGKVNPSPFTGAWLPPHLKMFMDTEHVLHVRGEDEKGVGLHFKTHHFAWKLNPRFNPETDGGFQMKLGYFIVPPIHVDVLIAHSLSKEVFDALKVISPTGQLIGYRLFVHPEAYLHFHALFEAGFIFVTSAHSEFIGTPTSSYRSWAVRKIVEDKTTPESVPFMVKFGVSGAIDRNRLLTGAEVRMSIQAQNRFDEMTIGPNLWIFKETLGLTLKNIPNYPPKNSCAVDPIDSGMLVREFPEPLLEGRCHFLSFSALMSVESLKHPGCFPVDGGIDSRLPPIFGIIHNAIEKGVVKTPFEFMQRFLVEGVLNALEKLLFQEGLSLSLHAQNLCFVLDQDNIPAGVAIRDHGDISQVTKFVETYSEKFRYDVFIKLASVLTRSCEPELPPLAGIIGTLPERSLYYYLATQNTLSDNAKADLERLSISLEELHVLLSALDNKYYALLAKYFNLSEVKGLQPGEPLPMSDASLLGDARLMNINSKLHLGKIRSP